MASETARQREAPPSKSSETGCAPPEAPVSSWSRAERTERLFRSPHSAANQEPLCGNDRLDASKRSEAQCSKPCDALYGALVLDGDLSRRLHHIPITSRPARPASPPSVPSGRLMHCRANRNPGQRCSGLENRASGGARPRGQWERRDCSSPPPRSHDGVLGPEGPQCAPLGSSATTEGRAGSDAPGPERQPEPSRTPGVVC